MPSKKGNKNKNKKSNNRKNNNNNNNHSHNGTTTTTTQTQTKTQQQQQQRACSCCCQPANSLKACARCKQAWYCSKKCQLDHFPIHKVSCRQVAPTTTATTTAKVKMPHPDPKQLINKGKMPDIATVDSEGQQTIADGIQVIETDNLGKACVATRSFATGDTVLLEPPAVVFDERDGYAGLFNAFLKATSETQQNILQMYRPSHAKMEEHLDEKRKKLRARRKQLLVHQYDQFIQADPTKKECLPLSLAEQLIGVVDANAHAFQAEHTVDIVATDTNDVMVPRTYHALFTLGSRVEHSCSPNLTFITKGGKLEYVAEMDIKPNQRLSISYLGSVYERPRKQRRGFLKENKIFLCKCTRCLSWDECSPLRCNACVGSGTGTTKRGGILFHHGERDQWECQSCDKTLSGNDDYIHQQLRKEAELFAKIRKFQYILQTRPYPEMLEEILEVVKSSQWHQIIHPLHWLNVEAYKLISSVAASAARYYSQEEDENNDNNNNNNNTTKRVSTLLRLSAMSMIRRILWQERIAVIDRGLMSLKEAIVAVEEEEQETTTTSFDAFSHETVHVEDVAAALEALCNHDMLKDLGTMGVSPAYHAGQDLIVADHKDLALKLYQRFEVSFERWKGLSDHSRDKIKAFLRTDGNDCRFGNFLLL